MERFTKSIATAALLLLAPISQAEDLRDVYQLALENDPVIREALANKQAAMEAKPQALANLLPQINLSGNLSDTRSSDLGSSLSFDASDNFATKVTRTRGDSENRSSSLTLSVDQSVFNWSDWVTLHQADSQVAQAEADYQYAAQQLIQRTVTAYFDVLAAQDDLAAQTANRDALERQLEQTKKRFEVGLIAITDVQESQAAFDNAVADEIAARRQLATSRESLRELTGVYLDDLVRPEGDIPLAAPEPESPDAWVEMASEQNKNLISARLSSDIAFDTLRQQKANLLPTVDLRLSRQQSDNEFTNNRFFNQFTEGFEAIDFPSVGNDTTISLSMNVPIWNGGRNYSLNRQRAHEHTAAKERLIATHRQVERETRDAYLGVISEISRVRALRQALQSSETAMKATEAGFEVGTRTTVDVLNSRQQLTQARTNYTTSRYEYIKNLVSLKLAAGSLTADDLTAIAELIDD